MRKLWLFSVLIVGLLAATLASAHDISLHKGSATQGEIVSVEGEKMVVKTATGPVTVSFSGKTKYEHGNQTVTKSHLKAGDKVAVFGTKLASGEVVAREILINPPAADSHHADHK
jgi:hypothetical protein